MERVCDDGVSGRRMEWTADMEWMAMERAAMERATMERAAMERAAMERTAMERTAGDGAGGNGASAVWSGHGDGAEVGGAWLWSCSVCSVPKARHERAARCVAMSRVVFMCDADFFLYIQRGALGSGSQLSGGRGTRPGLRASGTLRWLISD